MYIERETHENRYKQVLKLRTVYVIAAFLLIYVGVEVTLGSKHMPSILFKFLNERGKAG